MKAVAIATTVDAQEFQGLPAVVQIVEDFTTLSPSSLVDLGLEERS